MFGSLFKRKRRRDPATDASSLGDSIKDARVGDVFTIEGLAADYEDSYLIVEKLNRYKSASGEWYELLGVDGEKRLWVQWSDGGGLFVTANAEAPGMGLTQLGITEQQLIKMDEEHSVDNYITFEGTRYQYTNSSEALFYQDDRGEGEGYYLWEFAGEDKVMSVDKWEGTPFQAYISDVVPSESIIIYKR